MARRQKHDPSHEMGEFTDLLQQLILKMLEPFMDTGEVAVGTVQDTTGQGTPNRVDKQNRDVWTSFVDALNGTRALLGRLYAPAGILWRLPTTGATAHMVRGRKQNAPGGPLIVVDGGDGKAQVVPGFDDGTNLDANNSGILLGEGFHIESQNDRVRIVANSKGTKAVIELQKSGKITVTAASGQDIVFNGGVAKVARVGDATQGHVHVESGNAGPYPIAGTTQQATDTIAQGAANVKA